jgi:hypothetical protein
MAPPSPTTPPSRGATGATAPTPPTSPSTRSPQSQETAGAASTSSSTSKYSGLAARTVENISKLQENVASGTSEKGAGGGTTIWVGNYQVPPPPENGLGDLVGGGPSDVRVVQHQGQAVPQCPRGAGGTAHRTMSIRTNSETQMPNR